MDQKGLNHVKYVLHIFEYMEKMLPDSEIQYLRPDDNIFFIKIICPSSQIYTCKYFKFM